jgi:protein TonB
VQWKYAQGALILSAALHGALFWIASRTLSDTSAVREPESIKVRIAEPPRVMTTPAPPPVVNTPKPRPPVRVDRRQPVPEKPVPQPEVRAGLSDSLAKPDTARPDAPAVAVGNSSLAPVNPADADKPPPAPLSGTESDNVSEALTDSPAKCPVPPNLELTTDALNAGLTNAEVIIEVAVTAAGLVQDAKLKAGTGFEIDKVALKAALKLKCTPAVLSGKAVGVAGKKLVWKVMYD